jgi:5-formyltetrahydrofolate cyclo-ligase
MRADKQTIRDHMLQTRRAMTSEEVRTRSGALHAQLRAAAEFGSGDTLWTYVSSKDNEVDTLALITETLKVGRRVAVPRSESDGTLTWKDLQTLDALTPGRFGILEPAADSGPEVAPDSETVVLVPGLAFSSDGGRIGYGGGYFDRFLSQFNGISIGLAFDFQILDSLPQTPHDVPVSMVVSESQVYRPV